MPSLRDRLTRLLGRRPAPTCGTCAFVEFFRSNGDGQVARVHAFCRCPGGPHQDRPVPAGRRCERWRAAPRPPHVPQVGDPTLTA